MVKSLFSKSKPKEPKKTVSLDDLSDPSCVEAGRTDWRDPISKAVRPVCVWRGGGGAHTRVVCGGPEGSGAACARVGGGRCAVNARHSRGARHAPARAAPSSASRLATPCTHAASLTLPQLFSKGYGEINKKQKQKVSGHRLALHRKVGSDEGRGSLSLSREGESIGGASTRGIRGREARAGGRAGGSACVFALAGGLLLDHAHTLTRLPTPPPHTPAQLMAEQGEA